MQVQRFEDLIAWQKARILTKAIYQATRRGNFAQDHRLVDQIRAASVSIMSNLAEGFERGSAAQFLQFLSTSKASCAEVRSQLYVAYDSGYLEQSVFDDLMNQAQEVGRILGGLRISIEKKTPRRK